MSKVLVKYIANHENPRLANETLLEARRTNGAVVAQKHMLSDIHRCTEERRLSDSSLRREHICGELLIRFDFLCPVGG